MKKYFYSYPILIVSPPPTPSPYPSPPFDAGGLLIVTPGSLHKAPMFTPDRRGTCTSFGGYGNQTRSDLAFDDRRPIPLNYLQKQQSTIMYLAPGVISCTVLEYFELSSMSVTKMEFTGVCDPSSASYTSTRYEFGY